MSAGVSYDSVASQAAVTILSGGVADANYPLRNLRDLSTISNPARITGGGITLQVTFPAPVTIQMLALVRHSGYSSGAPFFAGFYSGPNQTGTVVASGTVAVVPDTVTGYPNVTPMILSAPVTCQSMQLVVYTASVLEIGALEIAKWWSWDLSPGKEISFSPANADQDLLGGYLDPGDRWAPRTFSGQSDLMALTTAQTTGIDFQRVMRTGKPFVFVQEATDVASWPRTAWLAVNQELPPSIGALYRHDTFQFRLVEYLR
jgi:hypothetical protein